MTKLVEVLYDKELANLNKRINFLLPFGGGESKIARKWKRKVANIWLRKTQEDRMTGRHQSAVAYSRVTSSWGKIEDLYYQMSAMWKQWNKHIQNTT